MSSATPKSLRLAKAVLATSLLLTLSATLTGCASPRRGGLAPVEGAKPVLKRGYIPELYGDREVTYTQTGDVATIEEDILVDPTDTPPAPGAVALRNGLWPGGIVFYTVEPGFSTVGNLMLALAAWESQTPIRFVRRTTQPGYVVFRNNPASGGKSRVGYSGRAQDILIAPGLVQEGIMHEIGHAIGLDHEHNSPRRDQFIKVLLDNVDDDKKYNFDIASYSAFALLRPYDFISLMHYGPRAAGKIIPPSPTPLTTMIRRDGLPGPLGSVGNLTANDIAGVEALYGWFTFMTRANGGPPISGKTCLTVGPNPSRFPLFQSKTGGAVLCVDKPGWLWSNLGLRDPRITGLPPDSYRCLEIKEPADPDFSREPSYLCYPFATPMVLTWSDSGARPGLHCVLFYAPEAGPAWADNFLCYVNGTVGVLGETPRDANGQCILVDAVGQAFTGACGGTYRWRMTSILPATAATTLVYEPVDYSGNYVSRCLGVAGASGSSGARVLLERCSGKASQTWTFETDLTLRTGGFCMRVAAGGAVVLGSCDGSPATQWRIHRGASTPL